MTEVSLTRGVDVDIVREMWYEYVMPLLHQRIRDLYRPVDVLARHPRGIVRGAARCRVGPGDVYPFLLVVPKYLLATAASINAPHAGHQRFPALSLHLSGTLSQPQVLQWISFGFFHIPSFPQVALHKRTAPGTAQDSPITKERVSAPDSIVSHTSIVPNDTSNTPSTARNHNHALISPSSIPAPCRPSSRTAPAGRAPGPCPSPGTSPRHRNRTLSRTSRG